MRNTVLLSLTLLILPVAVFSEEFDAAQKAEKSIGRFTATLDKDNNITLEVEPPKDVDSWSGIAVLSHATRKGEPPDKWKYLKGDTVGSANLGPDNSQRLGLGPFKDGKTFMGTIIITWTDDEGNEITEGGDLFILKT